MGFEPTTLGLGIRWALFLTVPPSVGECGPERITALGSTPAGLVNSAPFRWAHLQDISTGACRGTTEPKPGDVGVR